MKKLFFAILLSVFSPQILDAQVNNFPVNFRFVVDVITNDYAGFFDKVNKDTIGFEKFKNDILVRSISCKDSSLGYYLLLKELLLYFNDPHLTFGFNSDSIRKTQFFNHTNYTYQRKITHLQKKKLIKFTKAEKDALCTFWQDENNYTIRIKKKNQYQLEGVVVKADSVYWFSGQSKFVIEKKGNGEYFCYYLAKDHYLREINPEVQQHEISFGKFGRIFKGNNYFDSISQFHLKKLNDSIAYFRIPDFLPGRATLIDSIVDANKEDLGKVGFLIIDIRNNPGGSSISYQKLLPYLCSGAYTMKGSKYRKSQRNIDYYLSLLQSNDYDSSFKRIFSSIADSLKNCSTQFCRSTNDYEILPDTIYPYPKKIIFLINQRTVSLGELLVNTMRQSTRCISIGKETYGAMDYLDINTRTFLPCGFIRINYALARSNRVDTNKFANKGVSPNIMLFEESGQWINKVVQLIQSGKL
jgi:Peptidase family S41